MVFARCINARHIALAYAAQGIILNIGMRMTDQKIRICGDDAIVGIAVCIVCAVYALYAAVVKLDQVALVDRRSVAIEVLIMQIHIL